MATLTLTTGNDKKNGTNGNDKIDGLAGNDNLTGLSGNDTLLGGAGNDLLDGGVGNDSLLGGAGADTLLGGSDHDLLKGDEDNDLLRGDKGNDTLDGGVGADTLVGGDGNDVYVVDNARDVVTEGTGSLAGKDSVKSSIPYVLPLNVDNLELTGLVDLVGTGNDLANLIQGNDGNNLLDAKNGNDTLQGGDGDDTLIGGGGTDSLAGGDGSDTYRISSKEDRIVETARDGDEDVVESSISYTLDDNLEVLVLTGTNALEGGGNDLDNVVEGNEADNTLKGEGGNDSLWGQDGADTLDGGTGDDTLDGGAGTDAVIYLGNQDDYKITFDGDSLAWMVEDINGRNGDGVDEGTDLIRDVGVLLFADSDRQLTVGGDSQAARKPMTLQLAIDSLQLKAGDTGTVTFNFGDVPEEFDAGDVTVVGGQLTNLESGNGGKTWTARFIPEAGVDNLAASLSVAAGSYTDSAGLAGEASNVLQVTGDTRSPELTLESDVASLKTDETALITLRFSEIPNGFTAADVSVSGGMLSDVLADADGKRYTARFTPEANANDLAVNLSVPAASYTDAAGNTGIASNALQLRADTLAPTVRLTADKTVLKAGQEASLNLEFSEDPVDFTLDDILVTGGTLGNLAGSGNRYTAVFIPDEDQNTLMASINVAAGAYTDQSGNAGKAEDILSIGGDTLAPGVSISSDKTSLRKGESATLTFTFDDAPVGFDKDDIKLSGGSLSDLKGSGLTRTALFTPQADKNSLNGIISVPANSYVDANDNGNMASNFLSIAGDTAGPALVITSSRTKFKSGDTAKVTFTFDETPVGFESSDVTVTGGTLSALTVNPDNDRVYTATYTPNPIPPGVPRITTVLKEYAYGGYGVTSKTYTLAAGGGTFTLNYQMYGIPDKAEVYVDSTLVTATRGFVSNTGSLTINGNQLNKGSIVTVVMTGKDSGTAWEYDIAYTKGVLDPADPTNKFTGSIAVASDTYQDRAGNPGQPGNKLALTGDFLAPGLEIDVSRASFRAGETANVTFKFEEKPTGFTVDDVKVAGGSISNFTAADATGKLYTALLTPTDDVNTLKGSLQVPVGSYTDSVGNPGDAGNTIELSGDTRLPTLMGFSPADDARNIVPSASLTLNFSEVVKAGSGDIIISNDKGDRRVLSVTDINQVIFDENSVILDPKTNLVAGSSYSVQIPAGAILDMTGNPYTGITDPTAWNFSTSGSTPRTAVLHEPSGEALVLIGLARVVEEMPWA